MVMRVRTTAACLLLFAVLCLQPALSVARERPTGTALQFGTGSSFNLGRFGGATISYQRFLSEDLAFRLGATIEFETGTEEQAESNTGNEEGSDSYEFDVWDNRVSLSCEWIVYRGSDVSLYFGGGPHAFYDTRQDGSTDFRFPEDEGDYYRHYRNRYTSIGLGASGVIGVQWAPAEWFALHVEYRAVAAYVRGERREYRKDTSESHHYHLEETLISNGAEFDSKAVRAGVSVYF